MNIITNLEHLQEILRNNPLVLVDFTASWCGPCKRIAPKFQELSEQYPEITFCKVDVDECPEAADEYKIRSMPTFLMIQESEIVDQLLGAKEESLLELINRAPTPNTIQPEISFTYADGVQENGTWENGEIILRILNIDVSQIVGSFRIDIYSDRKYLTYIGTYQKGMTSTPLHSIIHVDNSVAKITPDSNLSLRLTKESFDDKKRHEINDLLGYPPTLNIHYMGD
jgi:thioredoxin 1